MVGDGIASAAEPVLPGTWLPLLLLSMLVGRPAGDGVTFLSDIETHVRFLVALPLLIAAEPVVHERLGSTVKQFIDRGIIVPEQVPEFNAAIESAIRLRDSSVIEIALIIFVYTIGHLVWREQFAPGSSTWYATLDESGLQLAPPGYWFAFVSIPLAQFILIRWYLRMIFWFWFLWRVSRLKLRLTPTHPDEVGGLGFVGNSAYAFALILFAQGALIAGLITNRIFYEGQSLMALKLDIVGSVVLLVLFVLGPLMVFIPNLSRAKQRGRREYGMLANRYVQEFDQKWIRDGAPEGDRLLGSSDIQSLADLANSYGVIRRMRAVPFGTKVVTNLMLVTAAPLLPSALTAVPIEAILEKLSKALL